MSKPIIYVDHSAIRKGKLQELQRAMTELAEFVDSSEPQLISYGFFIAEEASRMTVIAIHPDAASVEFHMEVVGPRLRKFAELVDLLAIEVYGEPSDKMLRQLHQKAQTLGDSGRVVVHRLHAGFNRVGAQTSNAL